MEQILHFVCENSVLLLNGSFVQSASSVRYDSDDPLFVTVLPLEAVYIPYTVEFLNGAAVTNVSFAICRNMGDGHFYIELKPRSSFVYSPHEKPRQKENSAPARLLSYVKEGNYAAARTLLTQDLNDSITDQALADFFSGVEYVRENVFTPQKGYLFIKNDGSAPRCDITVKNGLIENIVL